MPSKGDEGPHLRVRTIERVAIIHFEGAEILFEEQPLQAVREQLNRLIEEGHTRLVLNFEGVRYMSSNMLGILASLQKKNVPARDRIQTSPTTHRRDRTLTSWPCSGKDAVTPAIMPPRTCRVRTPIIPPCIGWLVGFDRKSTSLGGTDQGRGEF
jgi:anti-anti-sigma factor